MVSPSEKKRKKFACLYEILFTNYSTPACRVFEKLGIRSLSSLLEETTGLQIIVERMARMLSLLNLPKHVYLLNL